MGQRADFRQMAADIAGSFGDVPESGTYRIKAVTTLAAGTVTYGSNTDQALDYFVLGFEEGEVYPEPIRPGDWKAGFAGTALTAAPVLNAVLIRADSTEWQVVGLKNEDGIGAWWELHMTRAQ